MPELCKRLIPFSFILLILCSFASAHAWNGLTVGRADQRYCRMGGDCSIGNMVVENLTVYGSFVNTTVTDYDVVGNMDVTGNLTVAQKGIFGNNNYCVIGDDNNQKTIACSSSLFTMEIMNDDIYMGFDLTDASSTVRMIGFDPSFNPYGLHVDNLGTGNYIAELVNHQAAGNFSDGVNSVQLANDVYSIEAVGNVSVTGTGRFDAGLVDAFSRESVNLVNRELTDSSLNTVLSWSTEGLADFQNTDTVTTGDIDGKIITATGAAGIISLDGRTLSIKSLSGSGNVNELNFLAPDDTQLFNIYTIQTDNVPSRMEFSRGGWDQKEKVIMLSDTSNKLKLYGAGPSMEQYVERSSGGVGVDAINHYFDQTDSVAGPQNVMKIGTIGNIGDPSTSTYSYWDVGDDDVGSVNSVLKIGKNGGLSLNSNFNGIPTELIEANQYADSNGIKLYGYDDESAYNMHSYLDSSGNGHIDMNRHFAITSDFKLTLQSGNSEPIIIKNANGGAFGFTGDGADSIMYAASNDLIYRWSRAADNFTQAITFEGLNSAGTQNYFTCEGHDNSDDALTTFSTDLTIPTGDFNAGGNTTINNYYGEMWNYSLVTTPLHVDVDDAGVYYNVSGLVTGDCNGFIFTDVDTTLGGSYLTATVSGKYRLTMSASFVSQAVGGLFGWSIANNWDQNIHRDCYTRSDAQTTVEPVSVTCLMDLAIGDTVSIMVENENTNRDVEIHTLNLNLMRIGEI